MGKILGRKAILTGFATCAVTYMLHQSCALVNIDIHLVYALVWHIIMKGREKIQSGPFTSNILTCPLPTNITERFIEKPFLAIFIFSVMIFQICLSPPNTDNIINIECLMFTFYSLIVLVAVLSIRLVHFRLYEHLFFVVVSFCIWYLPLTYWLAPSGNITEKKHLFVSLTLFPLSLPVSPGLLYIGIFTDDAMSTMWRGGPWLSGWHILRMHSGNKLAKQDRCESLWWNEFVATEFLPKIWRKKTILKWRVWPWLYFRTNVLVFVGKEREKKSIFKTNGVTAVLRLPYHLTNERFKWGDGWDTGTNTGKYRYKYWYKYWQIQILIKVQIHGWLCWIVMNRRRWYQLFCICYL